MGRKPEEFDSLGEGALCRIRGDYSTATLYFTAGSIGIDVQTSAEFGENLVLSEETAEKWRDNLTAWLKWRNPEKYGTASRLSRLHCPTHGVMFTDIERRPNGRRLCPEGDAWMVAGGVLIPWGEV